MEEFKHAQLPTSSWFYSQDGNQGDNSITWQPPTINQVKLNWDAALNNSIKTLGLGMIIKDYKGEVITSACDNKQCQYSPVITEALTLSSAMTLCQDLGFPQVVFEGDCKEVVMVATSRDDIEFELYPLIYDIHNYIRNQPFWKVQYAPRETNQIAHNLAHLAFTVQEI